VIAVMVLPWNELIAVIITGISMFSFVCAYFRASLNAPSLASAPELQKKTFCLFVFFYYYYYYYCYLKSLHFKQRNTLSAQEL
jgi:hypothetical protein